MFYVFYNKFLFKYFMYILIFLYSCTIYHNLNNNKNSLERVNLINNNILMECVLTKNTQQTNSYCIKTRLFIRKISFLDMGMLIKDID